MLPNFVVIGAMKAGTTTLHRWLDAHPQVFVSNPKELHYFAATPGRGSFGARPANWDRGRAWYEAHFDAAGDAVAVGESSAGSYAAHPVVPGVPERMAATVPDAWLVYVLRDPIDRMWSQYVNNVLHGDPTPIDVALLEQPGYLARSSYAMQLDRYLEHFDREQILLLRFDDLRDRPTETARSVLGFLGVDPDPPDVVGSAFHRTGSKVVHTPLGKRLAANRVGRRMLDRLPQPVRARFERSLSTLDPDRITIDAGLRKALADRLRDDVNRLRDVHGVDVSSWDLS